MRLKDVLFDRLFPNLYLAACGYLNGTLFMEYKRPEKHLPSAGFYKRWLLKKRISASQKSKK